MIFKNLIKFPKVSIIMNCHNGEKFLNNSLRSVLNQSYLNWELIFWDNLSNDKSAKILKKFNDHRIKYFKSKKLLSLYKARNKALKKCSGKYVLFLDTDDLWKKDLIQELVLFLKKNSQYKIVYSNYHLRDDLKKKNKIKFKKKMPEGEITDKLLKNYTIGILSVCVERSIFKNLLFNPNYNIIGDFDFFVRISLSQKIGYIKKSLAYYRVHEENLSKKKIELHIHELSQWIKENEYLLGRNRNYTLIYQKIYLFKLRIRYFLKKIVGLA